MPVVTWPPAFSVTGSAKVPLPLGTLTFLRVVAFGETLKLCLPTLSLAATVLATRIFIFFAFAEIGGAESSRN